MLWHGARLHAKQEGGSSTPIYIGCVAVCKSCPECGVYVLCLCRKVGMCEVTGEKKTDVHESQGWRQGSTNMKRFVGLSRSSLA